MSKKKSNLFFWIFLFLAVITIVSLFTPVSKHIRSFTFTITGPVQESASESGGGFFSWLSVFRNTSEIKEEVEQLRRENTRYLSEIAGLQRLKEENEELKQILNIDFEEGEDYQISRVLSRKLNSYEVIVRHSEPTHEGAVVITPEKALVGFVVESGERVSTVRLLGSKDSVVEAKVQNENNPVGILRGDDSRILTADTISKEHPISLGELVVATSYQGVGLNEIYIGRVVKINDAAVDAFQSVVVRQGFDLKNLNHLIIIDNE